MASWWQTCVQYFSGGARRNPGPAGCGAAILAARTSTLIATSSAYLGEATSNEAAYQGLILGLQLALQHGAQRVLIRSSSELVIRQLTGKWEAKSPPLAARLAMVRAHLLPRLSHCEAVHVLRELNMDASQLAKEAMDAGASGVDPRLPSDALYV